MAINQSRATIADPNARQVAALNVQLGALDAARAQYQGRPTFDNAAFEQGRAVVLAKIAKLGGQVAPVAPAIRAPKAIANNTMPAWAQRKAAAMAKAGFTPATLLATVTTPAETETVELDLTPVAEPTPEPVAEPIADVQQPAKRPAKRNLAAILGE